LPIPSLFPLSEGILFLLSRLFSRFSQWPQRPKVGSLRSWTAGPLQSAQRNCAVGDGAAEWWFCAWFIFVMPWGWGCFDGGCNLVRSCRTKNRPLTWRVRLPGFPFTCPCGFPRQSRGTTDKGGATFRPARPGRVLTSGPWLI